MTVKDLLTVIFTEYIEITDNTGYCLFIGFQDDCPESFINKTIDYLSYDRLNDRFVLRLSE